MGLDAYVQCRCLAEGRALAFERPELIRPDETGVLELAVPWEGNEDLHLRFERWKQTACEHPGMELVTERISNWFGYRSFQQALAELGWELFPTLRAELPESNGGAMEPAAARAALAELDVAEARIGGDKLVLVDSDSGAEQYNYIAAYGGVFVWSGSSGVEIGFDGDGVFVRRPRGGDELFRARRIEVTEREIIDLDTETRIACVAGWGVGRRFHLESRPVGPGEFEYIFGPLRRVLQAAVDSGNPVIWC